MTTPWTRRPTSAQDAIRAVRAYVRDRRTKAVAPDMLVSSCLPVGMDQVQALAEHREVEADAHWQNGGWNVARCEGEHPLRWCAWNGLEEVADLFAYAVTYPGRTDHAPERQVVLEALCSQLQRNAAEAAVLLALMDELADG